MILRFLHLKLDMDVGKTTCPPVKIPLFRRDEASWFRGGPGDGGFSPGDDEVWRRKPGPVRK